MKTGKPKDSGLKQLLTPAMVKAYAAKGMSLKEIGLMYGYTNQRIGQLIGKDAELKEAWEAGNAELCDTLTSALMRLVEKDNLVAVIFALKARCGWVEQQYLLNKQDAALQPQVTVYLPANNRSAAPNVELPVNSLPF